MLPLNSRTPGSFCLKPLFGAPCEQGPQQRFPHSPQVRPTAADSAGRAGRAGRPACLPHGPRAHLGLCWRRAGAPEARSVPEGAAVPAERALTAPLLPPAAWPAGLAMPQPPPAAPRCRRLRDAQQRARTAAALTAAPDADRSRPLLEPSRVRAEPRTQVAADERRAPPRPAGPRMEGRSAQPHRACPPPPFRVPRPTPASRRAVRVHPLGPAPRLSGHGVRGAVRCALRSPSKGLRVCASRAALTGP